MIYRILRLAVLLLVAGRGDARAQSPAELVSRGIEAYHQLGYDASVALLRRALVHEDSLADTSRTGAYSYLAASEHYRGRGPAARQAFRQALWIDPRFRPDSLVFPPEVQNLFAGVRRETKAVAVGVEPGDRRVTLRVYASSLGPVTVAVEPPGGGSRRVLYEGPVADSAEVVWDGLDAAGGPPVSGSYVVTVGTQTRTLSVPLAVQPEAARDAPLPEAPSRDELLPERTSFIPALRVLAAGLAIAGVAVALPPIAGEPSSMGPERFVVSGAAGLVAVAGGLLQQPGRSIPENVATNARVRARWRQRADSTHAANALRRLEVPFTVVPGKPTLSPDAEP